VLDHGRYVAHLACGTPAIGEIHESSKACKSSSLPLAEALNRTSRPLVGCSVRRYLVRISWSAGGQGKTP